MIRKFFGSTVKNGPGADKLILDIYPNAVASYSLRKLRTDYNGACIRVRRGLDNALMDVGFSGKEINISELSDFIGGDDGFIDTWYDQSGNGRNVFNSTGPQQPSIISSGNIIIKNGRPSIYSSGSKPLSTGLLVFPDNGDVTLECFMVTDNLSIGETNTILGIMDDTTPSDRRKFLSFANDNPSQKSVRLSGGFFKYDSTEAGFLLFQSNYQGGGGVINSRINSIPLSVDSLSNLGLNFQTERGISLFSGKTTDPKLSSINPQSIGYLSEVIFYDREIVDRGIIETNIMNYYGI